MWTYKVTSRTDTGLPQHLLDEPLQVFFSAFNDAFSNLRRFIEVSTEQTSLGDKKHYRNIDNALMQPNVVQLYFDPLVDAYGKTEEIGTSGVYKITIDKRIADGLNSSAHDQILQTSSTNISFPNLSSKAKVEAVILVLTVTLAREMCHYLQRYIYNTDSLSKNNAKSEMNEEKGHSGNRLEELFLGGVFEVAFAKGYAGNYSYIEAIIIEKWDDVKKKARNYILPSELYSSAIQDLISEIKVSAPILPVTAEASKKSWFLHRDILECHGKSPCYEEENADSTSNSDQEVNTGEALEEHKKKSDQQLSGEEEKDVEDYYALVEEWNKHFEILPNRCS